MSTILEHFDTPGLTIYAKPSPLAVSSWSDDVVAFTENSSAAGYYTASVTSAAENYVVFRQNAGSPQNTDTSVGTIREADPLKGIPMKIRGTFNSGSTGSTLNISFTTDAPAVASAANMFIRAASGPLIGRAVRVQSLVDNGGGNYTATIFGALPFDPATTSITGSTFEMGEA